MWCCGVRESRLDVASLVPPSWESVPVPDWLLALSSLSTGRRDWSEWLPEPAMQGSMGHSRRKLQETGTASCSGLRVEEASGGKGKDGKGKERRSMTTQWMGGRQRMGRWGEGREVRMTKRDPEGREQQRQRQRARERARGGQEVWYIGRVARSSSTYDHRLRRIGHPVRSAIHKPQIGGLVVGWVTTSESPLLYVLFCRLERVGLLDLVAS